MSSVSVSVPVRGCVVLAVVVVTALMGTRSVLPLSAEKILEVFLELPGL